MRTSAEVQPDAEMQSKTSVTVDRGEHPGDDSEAVTVKPNWLTISLVVFSLALSMFLLGLDSTIISTAIPKITNTFHALDDVGWYASAYMLTFCTLQLIWGKLYSFWPAKWVYLAALGVFELGSLLCGVAQSSTMFIVGRAIAGAGSGGVSAGSFVLVAHRVPLEKRPSMVGIVSAAFGVGSIAGPLIGGAFTDNARLTWRWCFYINLPFGFVTAVAIVFLFPNGEPVKRRTRGWRLLLDLDLLGSFFFIPGVICLLLALQWGGQKLPWSNARIIALFVLFGVLMIIWVLTQMWRPETASVPPRLMRNRNMVGAIIHALMLGGAFYTFSYYVRTPPTFTRERGTASLTIQETVPPLVPGHQRVHSNDVGYHGSTNNRWHDHRFHPWWGSRLDHRLLHSRHVCR